MRSAFLKHMCHHDEPVFQQHHLSRAYPFEFDQGLEGFEKPETSASRFSQAHIFLAMEGHMSNVIVATTEPDDESDKQSSGQNDRRRKRAASAVPSREECLSAIAALNGLIALRILTSAQANSIGAGYVAILREHDRARQGTQRRLSDDDVRQIWNDQPHLIDMLESLLTDEQLEMVMRWSRSDEDRKA
jgi:hypothetical protein